MIKYFKPSKRVTTDFAKMSREPIDISPPINREMKELDRSFFHKEFAVVKASFRDPRDIGKFLRKYPQDILNIPGVRNVIKIKPFNSRAVLLTDRLRMPNDAENVLSKDCLYYFKKQQHPVRLMSHLLELDYEFWRTDQILGAVLPEELLDDIPSGFTQTGHIAHVNLRKEFKPYKHLIGQVILDKNPSIRTVVDKVDSIATVYRTFEMEVLAGDDDMIVEHKESNCIFRFNFQSVYWNSRLHSEHERLINLFQEGEVVFDVMAGVGPFSVPAAKRNVICFSNDLNPESYKYLNENIKLNHVTSIYPYNSDGHDFIKNCFSILQEKRDKQNGEIVVITPEKRRKKGKKAIKDGDDIKQLLKDHKKVLPIPKFINHFVMNLPDSAIEFLGDFNGIYEGQKEFLESCEGFKLPKVHVYCFEKFSPDEPEPTEDDLQKRVLERIKKQLQNDDLNYEDVLFQLVRKVSPTKPMYRASFTLPEAVAFGPKLEGKESN